MLNATTLFLILVLYLEIHSKENQQFQVFLKPIGWVGAQNLKKPADSSDWRQKLRKSMQPTTIMET